MGVVVLDSGTAMDAERHRPGWKTLLAFGIIYFVWGSTFYAIRVGVREVPPFLLAAMRFLIAGLALYGWTRGRREKAERARVCVWVAGGAFEICVGVWIWVFCAAAGVLWAV